MRCISSVVPKSDIAVTDFTVKNEPMFGYMPGSPERIELEAALVKYSDVTEDVPIVIGGQEYRTDDVRYQVMVNFNLFVSSKNETSNSPIHEFKVLQNVFEGL